MTDTYNLQNILHCIQQHLSDKNVQVLGHLNELKQILIPKNMEIFIPLINKILDLLLKLCDDTDVSIRHNAAEIMSSSVTVILPFQKTAILQFVLKNSVQISGAHSLIEMIDLVLQVSRFLTLKVAYELFEQIQPLFIKIAESNSEIVSEHFYNSASKLRYFIKNLDQRAEIIEKLANGKTSVLTNRWNVKTAAIFAYPELVAQSSNKFSSKYQFYAALPEITDNIDMSDITFEELLPFIEKDPTKYFDLLLKVPSETRHIPSFLQCVRVALQYGFVPPFDLKLFTEPSSDQMILSLQLECAAIGAALGLDIDIMSLIKKQSQASFQALSQCFNAFPSQEIFESILDAPIDSPMLAKSIVIFLTTANLIPFPSLKNRAINRLVELSKSHHEIVIKTLRESIQYFDAGRTTSLCGALLASSDLFDPNGFSITMSLFAELASRDNDVYLNAFFSAMCELDLEIFCSDIQSLSSFLDSFKKICTHSKSLQIPAHICVIPLLVLAAITGVFTGEWAPNTKVAPYNSLFLLLKEPRYLPLYEVVCKQPLVSLLELRDKAASAASSLRKHAKITEDRVYDILGKKLIPWPSSHTWLLLSASSKSFAETTGGLLSTDPQTALIAALRCPERADSIEIKEEDAVEMQALSIVRGDREKLSSISYDLVVKIDQISNVFFPELSKALDGNWMVVALKRHIHTEPVDRFIATPFAEWNGPPQFWSLLPKFLIRLRKHRSFVPTFIEEDCDGTHKFFARKYIALFAHDSVPMLKHNRLEDTSRPAEVADVSEDQEYLDAEIVRALRKDLYSKAKVSSFEDLIEKAPTDIQISESLQESLIQKMNEGDNESMQDIVYLGIELAVCGKTSKVNYFQRYLKMAPFRSVGILLADSNLPWGDKRLPFQEFGNGYPFLEHELETFAVSLLIHHPAASVTIKPVAPTSLGKIASVIGQKFVIALVYGTPLPYSKKNENDMAQFVVKYGASKFSINSLERWAKYSPLKLLKAILFSSLECGTFFFDALKEAVSKCTEQGSDDARLTIQANLMAANDSPVNEALNRIFESSKK